MLKVVDMATLPNLQFAQSFSSSTSFLRGADLNQIRRRQKVPLGGNSRRQRFHLPQFEGNPPLEDATGLARDAAGDVETNEYRDGGEEYDDNSGDEYWMSTTTMTTMTVTKNDRRLFPVLVPQQSEEIGAPPTPKNRSKIAALLAKQSQQKTKWQSGEESMTEMEDQSEWNSTVSEIELKI